MHSCIYEGRVTHRRAVGRTHAFRQSVFMMYLDLTELPHAFSGRWLWSTNRRAVARFDRRDYHGDPALPLDQSVRQTIQKQLGFRPDGSVRMLTNLRYWGYLINPISLYYCFDSQSQLVAVLAEVTNTPWGERHCYAVDLRRGDGPPPVLQKDLHVSPFMPMNHHYRWNLSTPGDRLTVGITNLENDEPVFQAGLALRRKSITTGNLARVLARYPAMTARIAGNIYFQALRLWWKGVPFVPHPRKSAAGSQTHSSSNVLPNPAHERS